MCLLFFLMGLWSKPTFFTVIQLFTSVIAKSYSYSSANSQC